MKEFFKERHIGPRRKQYLEMLAEIGLDSLQDLTTKIIPENILDKRLDKLPPEISEVDTIKKLKGFSKQNNVFKSYIGQGYYGTIVPGVIKRNILENPGWYTQYTPYQAEISQGRLEALLNFQTMVSDLTMLPITNASLLDEGTAAAEAMLMFYNHTRDPEKNTYLVSENCHPQTIEILKTRSKPIGIILKVIPTSDFQFGATTFGALLQYPDTKGKIRDYTNTCKEAHLNNSFICLATDLLALSLIKAPGEMGADAVVGNAQRFGVPMGNGGPHAAFFSTSETFKRKIPGRIIGLTNDSNQKPALRMALQTREQHIRREKATSNICTAQVLLAIMSGMFAIYHGPEGIKKIAKRVSSLTNQLATSLKKAGIKLNNNSFFDTINFSAEGWQDKAKKKKLNFRIHSDQTIGISIDETTTESDIIEILNVFNVKTLEKESKSNLPSSIFRKSSFLTHPVFNSYRSETEMLRYIHKLETKDLSLNTSMIALGSCTMKLNSTTEMEGISWPEISNIHPFAPENQKYGYKKLIDELGNALIEITGFDNISMQPNSGAQGEYAGLMIIRQFHLKNKNSHRNICLIPDSAHGTNPASAIMAGMKVVVIKCDKYGNISEKDLKEKVEFHSKNLAAIMVTYPSTHGVFEHTITDICGLIHGHGGQVYIDGANLNALVGLVKPGKFGGDVMHINLHKTFCIPHGGGGPGMGPIVCKKHLAPFLPGHIEINKTSDQSISAVSSAPFGSASILPISWAYITMMGPEGLREATQIAILNANYMAKKLETYYPLLYRGLSGYSAHEFIIDIRPIKSESGITEEDIAKRLMDYGFHAPTMSWPVAGTMMIEPTESESKEELDRFCRAMILIKKEIDNVVSGKFDIMDNPLKNAPHTMIHVMDDKWDHKYSRKIAAFPAKWLYDYKYWPTVSRVDNAYGDRNLVCTCPPISEYEE
ncbi:MAG: aminomethyl-transferring glycine dehydrogenase [Candidatus Neomarinimicrobiota bacterium]